jgi:hypothetical protein
MMVMPDDVIITLITSDERKVKVLVKVLKASQLAVDALCLDDPDATATVLTLHLPKVKYVVLTKIIEFLEVFVNYPFLPMELEFLKAPTFEHMYTHQFYKSYLEQFEEGVGFSSLLYEVALAGRYMGISSLLEMISVYITYKCETMNIGSDIRKIFHLSASMTKSEKLSLRRQQPWLFTKHDDDEM